MSGLRRSLVLATTSAVAAALVAVPGAPVSANELLWQFFEQHPRR